MDSWHQDWEVFHVLIQVHAAPQSEAGILPLLHGKSTTAPCEGQSWWQPPHCVWLLRLSASQARGHQWAPSLELSGSSSYGSGSLTPLNNQRKSANNSTRVDTFETLLGSASCCCLSTCQLCSQGLGPIPKGHPATVTLLNGFQSS